MFYLAGSVVGVMRVSWSGYRGEHWFLMVAQGARFIFVRHEMRLQMVFDVYAYLGGACMWQTALPILE